MFYFPASTLKKSNIIEIPVRILNWIGYHKIQNDNDSFQVNNFRGIHESPEREAAFLNIHSTDYLQAVII